MMRCLVIDTSTERGVVAVMDRGQATYHAQLPFGLQSAQALLPTLQQGLLHHDISLDSLSYIAVGIGPGSYTGIRVGATVAKSLAFALDLPMVGVCSLDGFIPSQDGDFAAVIDAKIGGLYLQTGRYEQGKVISKLSPRVCTLAEAAELLKEIKTIVTPNAEKIRPKLEAVAGRRWKWEETYPSYEQLALVASEKLKQGPGQRLELMYLRKTQAEIEKELD